MIQNPKKKLEKNSKKILCRAQKKKSGSAGTFPPNLLISSLSRSVSEIIWFSQFSRGLYFQDYFSLFRPKRENFQTIGFCASHKEFFFSFFEIEKKAFPDTDKNLADREKGCQKGLSQKKLKNIFLSFFRFEKSRSDSKKRL